MACLKLSNGDFGIEACTHGNHYAAPISITCGPRAVRAGGKCCRNTLQRRPHARANSLIRIEIQKRHD